jgi:hypothetical protein
MEEKIKITVIDTTKIAVKNFNDYQSISINITKSLQLKLSYEWQVVIVNNGFDCDQKLYKNISISGFMILKIESIEFIIFRLSTKEVEVYMI